MQQERLRALGQMASGIAHDINNAISPITLYIDSLLTRETGFSERARKQLEIDPARRSTTSPTRWRACASSIGSANAQLELAAVDVERALAARCSS